MNERLKMLRARCCVCGTDDAQTIGAGEDYEYRTSADEFQAVRCRSCELVYLNPRPDIAEFERIYPATYHAFDFSERDYGFVYKIRASLEARRLLSFCKNLPAGARILDVGCGDGFHLKILREYGDQHWMLEGVDFDSRAVRMAEKSNVKIHLGSIEELSLPKNSFDLAFMIQTVEHLENPARVLAAIREVLQPGGRLVIVTDNTDALDFKIFKNKYWGGYHFPRHWNLFNRKSLGRLAARTGFETLRMQTIVSPVNWVYSIHNWLVDRRAPGFLINRFTLKSVVSLSAFTSLDIVLQRLGKGALLQAVLQKPKES